MVNSCRRRCFLKRFLLVLFIVLASTAGAVAAQADDSTTTPQTVTGTVVSTGNISFAIRTDDGSVKSLFLVSTTTMPGTGLNPGDRVIVAYQPLDGEHSQTTGVALAGTGASPAVDPAAASAPPVGSAEDSSRAWEVLAFVGLVGLLMALGVALIAGLFRPHHAERPHTTV
jgi:hypothetical protein